MLDQKYIFENQLYRDLKSEIKRPHFQRNLVWKEEAKRSFVDTVHGGYPFGAILLYKKDEKEYLLVDGLQRFSTLQEFEKDKSKYMKIEDVCKDEIDKIIDILLRQIKKECSIEEFAVSKSILIIKDEIIKAIKMSENNNKLSTDIILKITDKLPYNITLKSLMTPITECVDSIIKKLNNYIDMDDLRIPTIIYKGDENMLSEIFFNMNSKGTKLSKYEIFAAAWSEYEYIIDDKEILDIVEKKYNSMLQENQNIEIENYQVGDIINTKKINLFEYCFAIGKIIKENSPEIFRCNSNNESDIESIGFSILIALCENSIKKMGNLPKYLNNVNSNKLKEIKNVIVECTRIVNETMKPYIISVDNKNYAKYIESQILTMIMTVFKIKYEFDNVNIVIKQKENSKKYTDKFRRNAPQNYLYDILRGYWAGSGDSKFEEEIKKDIINLRYVSSISTDVWNTILYDWMENQSNKALKNISADAKLFLNYLINPNVTIINNYNMKFDIEHIIPINRLNNKFKDRLISFSDIGNLCYLPVYENRAKKDETLYEYMDRCSVNINIEVNKTFLYPTKGELIFIKENDKFTEERYNNFLKARHNYLISVFINNIS